MALFMHWERILVSRWGASPPPWMQATKLGTAHSGTTSWAVATTSEPRFCSPSAAAATVPALQTPSCKRATKLLNKQHAMPVPDTRQLRLMQHVGLLSWRCLYARAPRVLRVQ
jgi:hypothetical protein